MGAREIYNEGNLIQKQTQMHEAGNPTTKVIAFSWVCLELGKLLSMAPRLQLVADLHSLLIS